MASWLLPALAFWAGCLPCLAVRVATQPRVWCQASRYPVAVDCSWDPLPASDSAGTTSFVATYRLGVAAHGESQPCLQAAPNATSCTILEPLLFSAVPYVLNVTAMPASGGGGNSTFTLFVAENIIKPDPPEEVRLSPLPGQRLHVQWAPPRSWPFPDIFSLKYWVRYRRPGGARFRQVGPIEATSVTLRAVRPHARYHVQVAAQDLTDYGEVSDWSLLATGP
ncbi:interleukin-27 subunit beta [Ochotona curzoniae]|uniref:interleukin-27 subunit beta n=1 Tax=Ochotona curzoniae TaxID=130825 RepID=UPI001B346852|nr:interleukin-27 subunit beta [Ochotona curzoniae]